MVLRIIESTTRVRVTGVGVIVVLKFITVRVIVLVKRLVLVVEETDPVDFVA
jgi:hypothetical protein